MSISQTNLDIQHTNQNTGLHLMKPYRLNVKKQIQKTTKNMTAFNLFHVSQFRTTEVSEQNSSALLSDVNSSILLKFISVLHQVAKSSYPLSRCHSHSMDQHPILQIELKEFHDNSEFQALDSIVAEVKIKATSLRFIKLATLKVHNTTKSIQVQGKPDNVKLCLEQVITPLMEFTSAPCTTDVTQCINCFHNLVSTTSPAVTVNLMQRAWNYISSPKPLQPAICYNQSSAVETGDSGSPSSRIYGHTEESLATSTSTPNIINSPNTELLETSTTELLETSTAELRNILTPTCDSDQQTQTIRCQQPTDPERIISPLSNTPRRRRSSFSLLQHKAVSGNSQTTKLQHSNTQLRHRLNLLESELKTCKSDNNKLNNLITLKVKEFDERLVGLLKTISNLNKNVNHNECEIKSCKNQPPQRNDNDTSHSIQKITLVENMMRTLIDNNKKYKVELELQLNNKYNTVEQITERLKIVEHQLLTIKPPEPPLLPTIPQVSKVSSTNSVNVMPKTPQSQVNKAPQPLMSIKNFPLLTKEDKRNVGNNIPTSENIMIGDSNLHLISSIIKNRTDKLEIKGQSGATFSTLHDSVAEINKCNTLIIQGGTNDAVQLNHPSDAIPELQKLIRTAKIKANHVILVPPPPTRESMVTMERIMSDEASHFGVDCIHISHLFPTTGPHLFRRDGLHCTKRGAGVYGLSIINFLKTYTHIVNNKTESSCIICHHSGHQAATCRNSDRHHSIQHNTVSSQASSNNIPTYNRFQVLATLV